MDKKLSAPSASIGKKAGNPSNAVVPLSQNEIELKSLKGKFSDAGNEKSAAKDATTTAPTIKGN